MKSKIHPDYHTITVVMTDGTSFETKSTWEQGRRIDAPRYRLQDPFPARTGVRQSIDRGGRVQRFKDRFGMTGSAMSAGAKTAGTAKPRGDTRFKAAAKK